MNGQVGIYAHQVIRCLRVYFIVVPSKRDKSICASFVFVLGAYVSVDLLYLLFFVE